MTKTVKMVVKSEKKKLTSVIYYDGKIFFITSHMTTLGGPSLGHLYNLMKLLQIAGKLKPSHRRSLYTLATSMIIFTAKAYNIMPLAPRAKVALTSEVVRAKFLLLL